MPDAQVVAWIQSKYLALVWDLDERGRQRWAAAEARALSWGGITAVARATGLSARTIRNGIGALAAPPALLPDRQRQPGGGRRCRQDEQPGLQDALDALLDSVSRGDPTKSPDGTNEGQTLWVDQMYVQSGGKRAGSLLVSQENIF